MPDDHASSADRPIVCGADGSGRPDRELAADRHVRVLLPLPLPSALDYLAPDGGVPPEPGSFVRAPLGRRSLVGVVWGVAEGGLPVERLKPVVETLPIPPLRPELRRFVERVAVYTMARPAPYCA